MSPEELMKRQEDYNEKLMKNLERISQKPLKPEIMLKSSLGTRNFEHVSAATMPTRGAPIKILDDTITSPSKMTSQTKKNQGRADSCDEVSSRLLNFQNLSAERIQSSDQDGKSLESRRNVF